MLSTVSKMVPTKLKSLSNELANLHGAGERVISRCRVAFERTGKPAGCGYFATLAVMNLKRYKDTSFCQCQERQNQEREATVHKTAG